MYFVRDRVTMRVVTHGSDRQRCRRIAGSSERLEMRQDLNAGVCFANVPMIKIGWKSFHPYDVIAHNSLQAELEVLRQWHLAGGNA